MNKFDEYKQNFKTNILLSVDKKKCYSNSLSKLNDIKTLFSSTNKIKLFDFIKEIRKVNQIKNTTLKLKETNTKHLNKIFDPNLIDEEVIDFFFDTQKNKLFVTLKCGQIFIFTQKKNNFYGNFRIEKKITLKQKILKMKKIEAFPKEIILSEDEEFDNQTDRTCIKMNSILNKNISLMNNGKRSSSLIKQIQIKENQSGTSSIRSFSLHKELRNIDRGRESFISELNYPFNNFGNESLSSKQLQNIKINSNRYISKHNNKIEPKMSYEFSPFKNISSNQFLKVPNTDSKKDTNDNLYNFKKQLKPNLELKSDRNDQSIRFNDSMALDEITSCFDFEKSCMLNGLKHTRRDYLILFVNTFKTNNHMNNIKMFLFDLKLDKISMVYNMPAIIFKNFNNSNKLDSEIEISLPKIKILNDYLHFIVYNSTGIWIYQLFSKDPIVNITSPESCELQFVEFSFDYKKMLISFSDGNIIIYDIIALYDDLIETLTINEFKKVKEFNINNLIQNYIDGLNQNSNRSLPLSNQSRDKDFIKIVKFVDLHSANYLLSIISNKNIMFIKLPSDMLSPTILNIKSHQMKINSFPKVMVLENPVLSKADILIVNENLIRCETVSYDNQNDFIIFERNQQLNIHDMKLGTFKIKNLDEFDKPVLFLKQYQSCIKQKNINEDQNQNSQENIDDKRQILESVAILKLI